MHITRFLMLPLLLMMNFSLTACSLLSEEFRYSPETATVKVGGKEVKLTINITEYIDGTKLFLSRHDGKPVEIKIEVWVNGYYYKSITYPNGKVPSGSTIAAAIGEEIQDKIDEGLLDQKFKDILISYSVTEPEQYSELMKLFDIIDDSVLDSQQETINDTVTDNGMMNNHMMDMCSECL